MVKIFNVVSRIKFSDGILYGEGTLDLSLGDVVLFNNNERAIVSNNTGSMFGASVVALVLLGKVEERFKNDFKNFTFIGRLEPPINISSANLYNLNTNNIDLEETLKELNSVFKEKVTVPEYIIPKVPKGFYYCQNELHLEQILRDNEIYKIKHKIDIDIRCYPCLLTIDNKTLECGTAFVYSLNKNDFKELEDYL